MIMTAAMARAQFVVTTAGTAISYATLSNWTANTINNVFSQTATGTQVIIFTSTDTTLSSGLTFNLGSSNALKLEAGGGPYTLALGGDISMASVAGAAVTIGNATASSALNVNLNGNRTFTVGASNTLSIINVITGAGLTKAGAGTLELFGVNTYTGGTAINGGVVSISSDTNLGDSGGSLIFDGGTLKAATGFTSARSITLGSGGGTLNTNTFSVTLSGVIGGTGSFTHQGTGILTLSGTNTYTGGTTGQGGGVIDFTSDANLGATSSAVTLNGGFLRTQAAIPNFTHAIVLGASGGNLNTNGFNSTFSGAISGSGNLNVQSQSGNGILTLTNTGNSYTGTTFLNSGTLQVGATNALPTTTKVTISSGATLDVAFDQTVAGISSTGVATIASGKQLTVNATSVGLQFDGVISGAGIFVKDGTTTLNLTGANTYTGGTILKGGNLNLLSANALGASGTITFGGGALQFSSSNTTDYSARFSALSSQQYSIDTNGQNVTLASPLTSSGGTLTKLGSGTLTLSASNSYTGGTTINSGYLVIAANGALPGNVTFTGSTGTGGGELQFSTGATNILISGTIAGPGQVTQLSTGAVSLSGANTYSGTTNVNSGTLNAVNASGSATGTGSIVVSSGATLQIGTGGTTGSVSGDITNNGLVFFNRSDASTYAGLISGPSSGSVTIAGTGVTTFTGANTYAGGTIISTGATLSLANAAGTTLSSSSDVSLNGTGKLNVTVDQMLRGIISTSSSSVIAIASGKTLTSNLPSNQTNEFAGLLSGTGSFKKDGPGILTFTSDQPFVGGVTVAGGTLQLGNGGSSGGFGGNIVVNNGATLAFNRADTTPITYSGIVSGAGSFVKTGSSTLILTGANTFTGGVSLLAGTIRVGLANAVPKVAVNINSGATLDVANDVTIATLAGAGTTVVAAGKTLRLDSNQQLSSTISGAGNVEIGDTVTLVTDQTYTGTTTVSFGTLNLGGAGTNGSVQGNIIIGTGGQGVQFNRSNAYTFGGVISGNGFVSQNGTGVLTLAGANTYTGATNVNGGTLKVAAANALPATTAVSIASNATLDVAASQTINRFGTSAALSSILVEASQILNVTLGNFSGDTSFAGVISGAGGLRVGTNNTNGRAVTLTADATYTGGTTIDTGGMLRLGFETNAGMIVGNVANNGALVFQRSTAATFNGVISGTGRVQVGATGAATLGDISFTAANTYSGGTQVLRGSLFASNATGSATGSGSVSVSGSGVLGGTGRISGALSIGSGGAVAPFTVNSAPGTLSVGDTTFASGGKFSFGMNKAVGVAGTDYSLLSISGTLTNSATSSLPFTVALISFSAPGTLGALPGFDSSQSYTWTFATATGGISGFDAASFGVDTSKFGSTFPGSFSVGLSGNSLLLQYSPTAVPEPSTWALLIVGLGAILAFGLRERQRSRRS